MVNKSILQKNNMITTDIEKKSLEAHVELCAERYKNLDNKLDNVESRVSDVEKKLDSKMNAVEAVLDEIKEMITSMRDDRNRQIITWGMGVLSVLLSIIGFLVWEIIKKGQ